MTPEQSPWNKWKVQETPQESTKEFIDQTAQQQKPQQIQQEPAKESVPWAKYKQEGEYPTLENTPQKLASLGSRTGEIIAGTPGNIMESIRSAVTNFPGAAGITGMAAEKAKPGILEKAFTPNKKFLGGVSQLPTSKELKELSGKATGGYTLPKTKGQAATEEKYEDVLSLMLQPPGTQAFKAARIGNRLVRQAEPLLRAIGTTVFAHGAKDMIGSIGGGETAQALTKMGAMVLGGFLIPGQNARQLSTDLYRQRDASLQGVNRMVDTRRFNQRLQQMRTDLSRGTPSAGEREVIGRIDDLLQHTQGGFADIDHFTAAQRQINDARQNLFNLPREARGTGRQQFHRLARNIQDEIQTFGQTNAPADFLRFHNAANEVYGAMQASQYVGNMVQRVAPIMNLKSPIASALSHGAAGVAGGTAGAIAKAGLGSAIPITAGAGIGLGVYNAAQIMDRVIRSPHLRNMYANVVRNSLEGNAVAMMTNLRKLDDGLAKDLERNKNIKTPEQRRQVALEKRKEASKGPAQAGKVSPAKP